MGSWTIRPVSLSRETVIGALVLGGILLGVMILSMFFGAVDLGPRAVWSGDHVARTILLQIRLPRVLLAALVGAILAGAGATFQTMLRNPLADPFILGVSGGAACGAAIASAFRLARYPGVVPAFAFAGACLAIAVVLALSRRHGTSDPVRLLLAGLVLNAFFSALILLALALTAGSDLTSALRWMMGSLAGAVWTDVRLLSIAFVVSFALLVTVAGDLRMLDFGEDDARSRGVPLERVRLTAFLAASLATGAAVAVSGIIGFVGLLVPHAIRLVLPRDYRLLLPLSVLGGATLLVASDTLARVMVAPAELPIGAVTAFLGVPFFLILLRRS
ncbi:MAG TPA: iron ABC transporter permease [Thermoanaerobaculia bacterium]|nr:iron ABC transporter permease [Thermoanaerobaculia bacterium]